MASRHGARTDRARDDENAPLVFFDDKLGVALLASLGLVDKVRKTAARANRKQVRTAC